METKGITMYQAAMEEFDSGRPVMFLTAYKAWVIKPEKRHLLKTNSKGECYMQSGKKWVCMDGCGFRVQREKVKK